MNDNKLAREPLHFGRLWQAIGLSLVALVTYLSLMPDPPSVDIDFAYVDRVEHMLAYFAIMTWYTQIYVSTDMRVRMAIALSAMGVIIEVLQGLMGTRSPELWDAVAGFVGVLLAWALAVTPLANALRRIDRTLADWTATR